MSKKIDRRKQKHKQPERNSRGRQKAMLVIGLVLILGMTGVILARWRAARVTNSTSAMLAPPAPPSFAPNSPSKEYVYAGGRLLATEEPTAGGVGPYALSLNGTDAYVQANYSTSLNITGAITLEAWVKYNSTGNYQVIVAHENFSQAGHGGYALQISNLGKMRFVLFQGGAAYVTVVGATTITTGVWHHVAGVFDGSQRRVYLDGVLDGSVTGSAAPASSTAGLKIGRMSSTPYYFNGLIDEVRVSNAALYSANFTPQDSLTSSASTKGLWKFTDQTATDTSSNGNNGTLQGGAVYSTDVP